MKIKVYFTNGSTCLYDYSEVFKGGKDVCIISDHICPYDIDENIKEIVRYNSDNCKRIVFVE